MIKKLIWIVFILLWQHWSHIIFYLMRWFFYSSVLIFGCGKLAWQNITGEIPGSLYRMYHTISSETLFYTFLKFYKFYVIYSHSFVWKRLVKLVFWRFYWTIKIWWSISMEFTGYYYISLVMAIGDKSLGAFRKLSSIIIPFGIEREIVSFWESQKCQY